MDWVAGVVPNGDPRGRGLAMIKVAPDADHKDPNITGCRHVTNCTEVAAAKRIVGYNDVDITFCYVLPRSLPANVAVTVPQLSQSARQSWFYL